MQGMLNNLQDKYKLIKAEQYAINTKNYGTLLKMKEGISGFDDGYHFKFCGCSVSENYVIIDFLVKECDGEIVECSEEVTFEQFAKYFEPLDSK